MKHRIRRDHLPPARQFYELALGNLGRERRGWAPGRCPFHKSKSGKSFSASMTTGSFHCFGCGAKGSMIDFVMLRDHLTLKEACQALGVWDEAPTPSVARKMKIEAAERDRLRELEQARQDEARRHRLQLREQLHAASWAYNLVNARLSELRAGAMPDWPTEQEDCWSTLAVTLRDQRSLDAEYCAAAGLEYERG